MPELQFFDVSTAFTIPSSKTKMRVRRSQPTRSVDKYQPNFRLPRLMPELQFFDVSTAFTIPSAGAIQVLSDIAQGDGASNRDGVVVHPISLEIRGFFGVTASGTHVRIIIGRYLIDQASPTVAQLLENSNSPENIVSAYSMQYNGQSKDDRRIEILHDENLWFNPTIATADKMHRKYSFDLSRIEKPLIRWQTSNATNVPVFGGYFVAAFGTSNNVDVRFYSRLTFVDA
jgi:hypothetical protein